MEGISTTLMYTIFCTLNTNNFQRKFESIGTYYYNLFFACSICPSTQLDSLQVNLKCPASDLDLSTTSHLAMTPDEVDAKVKLTYLDKSGRNKIAALSGKLHKLRKILRLIVSLALATLCDINLLEMIGNKVAVSGYH